jgi:hypothetical protein
MNDILHEILQIRITLQVCFHTIDELMAKILTR